MQQVSGEASSWRLDLEVEPINKLEVNFIHIYNQHKTSSLLFSFLVLSYLASTCLVFLTLGLLYVPVPSCHVLSHLVSSFVCRLPLYIIFFSALPCPVFRNSIFVLSPILFIVSCIWQSLALPCPVLPRVSCLVSRSFLTCVVLSCLVISSVALSFFSCLPCSCLDLSCLPAYVFWSSHCLAFSSVLVLSCIAFPSVLFVTYFCSAFVFGLNLVFCSASVFDFFVYRVSQLLYGIIFPYLSLSICPVLAWLASAFSFEFNSSSCVFQLSSSSCVVLCRVESCRFVSCLDFALRRVESCRFVSCLDFPSVFAFLV